jgi:phenylalanyl-tRNA synthetase alpha chain
MENELQRLKAEAEEALQKITDKANLEEFRVTFLGRKGLLSSTMKQLGKVPKEDRPRLGQLANTVKKGVEELFLDKKEAVESGAALTAEDVDLSLPGRFLPFGKLHPVTQVMEEICSVFEGMGFAVAEGPDVETDHYNFEALNIPRHHPARDMHDTFYVSESILLRTHTSPMQARIMENQEPPLRYIAPGKVYRCDSDVTHTPMFHQVEGLLVDRDISMGDLKGVLTRFVHEMFGKEIGVRFRPSFFPFTEPSAEVDIWDDKRQQWLEILGCGMVDPAVFENVGYDPNIWHGYAFGLGIERIAMLKYGITDIRLFFQGDKRFLEQF